MERGEDAARFDEIVGAHDQTDGSSAAADADAINGFQPGSLTVPASLPLQAKLLVLTPPVNLKTIVCSTSFRQQPENHSCRNGLPSSLGNFEQQIVESGDLANFRQIDDAGSLFHSFGLTQIGLEFSNEPIVDLLCEHFLSEVTR